MGINRMTKDSLFYYFSTLANGKIIVLAAKIPDIQTLKISVCHDKAHRLTAAFLTW